MAKTELVNAISPNKPLMSYLQVVARIALIILVIEFFIMLLLALPFFDAMPQRAIAVIDALLLVTLSTPPIYFFIIKPFMTARDDSHRFLQTIMASISHPFYVVDANDYHIAYANPAAAQGRDCSRMTCHALTHHSATPCEGVHTCPLQKVKMTKRPVVVEHIHYDNEGKPINVEVHGYPIFDRHGDVVQMIEYSMDISQRKRAEAEVIRSIEKELIQGERMASLGDLVAGFTHDLKTPISVARGSATHIHETYRTIEKLIAQEEVSEQALMAQLDQLHEAAQLCDRNLQNALDMINSMKRISIDQTSGNRREFKLCELISDTVTSLHHKFKRTDIAIENRCDPGLVIVAAPGVMVQILTNLLNNSLLHAYNDGRESGTIHISAQGEDGDIIIDYTDDGAGMDEATRERIFERFFTTAHDRGGSGVGLFTVRALVMEELGGTINCHSVPGRGTRFLIRIPITDLPKE